MLSSHPSFVKDPAGPSQKKPSDWLNPNHKKGKFLDTAAAFVGLPHIISNE